MFMRIGYSMNEADHAYGILAIIVILDARNIHQLNLYSELWPQKQQPVDSSQPNLDYDITPQKTFAFYCSFTSTKLKPIHRYISVCLSTTENCRWP